MMVALTCPSCGAQLEFDDARQFAFCQYCGTKIVNIAQKVDVTFDRRAEIQNLLLRAREFEQRHDFDRAREYCSRVLDMDPGNLEARSIENRLPNFRRVPNVAIIYRSTLNDKMKLRITTDGIHWYELSKDQQIRLYFPVGKHRILFSGTKSYNRDIVVTDDRKLITVTYTGGRRNTIDVAG